MSKIITPNQDLDLQKKIKIAMEKVNIQNGDVFVIKVPENVNLKFMQALHQSCIKVFDDLKAQNVSLLITTTDQDIYKLSPYKMAQLGWLQMTKNNTNHLLNEGHIDKKEKKFLDKIMYKLKNKDVNKLIKEPNKINLNEE